MRISLVTPPSQNVEPYIKVFESKGVKVDHNSIHPDADFIMMTTQAWLHLVDNFHNTFPDIPIVSLTLDFYKSIWNSPNPHGYNWNLYKHYLNKAEELWCISNEVITRMEEEGIDKDKCHLMKIWARFFEYEGEIKDDRYILKTIRPYKYDKNYGWLQRACSELNIPLKQPNHGASEQEYHKLLAECSFMCSEYHETSTGGLGILEGYKLGKVSVVSDSPYHGAIDYLGDRAIYFDDNNYENFKQIIKETWNNTPQPDLEDCINFCNNHPTIDDNVDFMIERMNIIKKRGQIE